MAETLNTTRRSMMGGVVGAMALVSVPAFAVEHPDAELLRLGRELEKAWANQQAVFDQYQDDNSVEADEIIAAAYSAAHAVIKQIEGIPALTLAGLRIKAKAVSCCHDGEEMHSGSFGKSSATDLRLAATIVRDLLNIGDAA